MTVSVGLICLCIKLIYPYLYLQGSTRLPRALALRPAFYAGPMRIPRRGECVVLRGSHRCHWWGVCVCVCVWSATPLFSGPGSSNRLISGPRESWGVWGQREEREELRDLEPVIDRLVGSSQCFFLSVLTPACMPTYYPTLSTPLTVGL